MPDQKNYWAFSSHYADYYGDSDWDITTILDNKRFYFKKAERNRKNVTKGDLVLLRQYGTGFWGSCEIADDWLPDNDWETKGREKETGWFPVKKISRWDSTLPYEIIQSELSNGDHRSRIARLKKVDWDSIRLAHKVYTNLGYGDSDGNFFVLESGLEEAVKANLGQLGLVLADESVQQQCDMGIGVGRSDLICLDEGGNYVVLELKVVASSDFVIGQVLRYMGFVRENWATEQGKEVRGLVLTPSYDEQLRLAAAEAGIKVLRVRF